MRAPSPLRRACPGLPSRVPPTLALGLAALLASAPGRAAEPEGRVVERVVAVLEDAVITQGDLLFEARVMLVQQQGAEALRAPVDEALLARVLQLSLVQRLQAREADRLGLFALEAGEREALLEAFAQRLAAPGQLQAFLEAHGVDGGQLASLLERNARAERALESRLRGRAQVTEAEVRRHYEEHAAALGQPFPAVRERLREELVRERSRAVAAEEVAQLLRGARVRRVAPWAREEVR